MTRQHFTRQNSRTVYTKKLCYCHYVYSKENMFEEAEEKKEDDTQQQHKAV